MLSLECSTETLSMEQHRDVDVWTLTETDRQDFEAFKMWIWRRM